MKARPAKTNAPFRRARTSVVLTVCAALAASLARAELTNLDETRLPPAATVTVEFARDVKPILEAACLRCHGAERPKSRFSLVNRESALKGGANGVDIVPGDSGKSTLIHYVARVVTDMEMPPDGKGSPLTTDQIGILRAWIDQGATWETNAPGSAFSLTLSSTLGWTGVSGDAKKFREHHWMQDGWNGGFEDFAWSAELGHETKFGLEGRALVNDYRVLLSVQKADVGFTRVGWEQFRKYSDDTGGYFPNLAPSSFSLNRDLALDVGRAWADFGLTLPDWPRIVLGYEYQYRDGEKSTLQWGTAGVGLNMRSIYPAYKVIGEHTHVLKLDLDHEIAGLRLQDNFRGEFYDLQTRQSNARSTSLSDAVASRLEAVREHYHSFQGANTFRLEKPFTDWLTASAGYLYSKLNADATFTLDPQFPLGVPAFYSVERWRSEEIVLERESHVFNASALLGSWDGLTVSAGLLADWTRQTGFGQADMDIVTPFTTNSSIGLLDGNADTATFEEDASLRYTRIPFTVLFAEARWRQEERGLSESTVGGFHDFMQRTEIESEAQDYRFGFNTSPWKRMALSAYYRHHSREFDYGHAWDQAAHDAYPAFIRWRAADGDEFQTKLTLRPNAHLTTSLEYKYANTDYRTATEPAGFIQPEDVTLGSRLKSAEYDAHIFNVSATLTPWRRLYLSGTLSYQHARLEAFANHALSVTPYRGDRVSVLTSATYALNDRTDLHASYSFSWADYNQGNYADGLPLGSRYQEHALTAGIARRLNKNTSVKLRYGFFHYEEPSGGGVNDYSAHALFATYVVRFQ